MFGRRRAKIPAEMVARSLCEAAMGSVVDAGAIQECRSWLDGMNCDVDALRWLTEERYLRLFAIDMFIDLALGATADSTAIGDAYRAQWPVLLSDTSYSTFVKERLPGYLRELKTRDSDRPVAQAIGKAFAGFCGDPTDAMIVFVGSRIFNTLMNNTVEFLRKQST